MGMSKEEINKYLHNTYVSVLEGKIDIESIIKRARLRSMTPPGFAKAFYEVNR